LKLTTKGDQGKVTIVWIEPTVSESPVWCERPRLRQKSGSAKRWCKILSVDRSMLELRTIRARFWVLSALNAELFIWD